MKILDLYDGVYKWANSAREAGEDAMAALAFDAAALLRQAADLYHATEVDQ